MNTHLINRFFFQIAIRCGRVCAALICESNVSFYETFDDDVLWSIRKDEPMGTVL